MGIDGMRVGGGRCPPLLVAGLVVACFLLVCNWWSLAAENSELLRQIDGLSQQLKLCAEQRDQCMTARHNLDQRYKNADSEIASLHVQLGQERDSEKTLEDKASMCNMELNSLRQLDFTKNVTLQTLKLEKISMNSQLEARKKENERLQTELDKVKEELSKLQQSTKLNQDSTTNKKPVVESPVVLSRGMNPVAPHLGPVSLEAVHISPSGQHGIMYHGVPVLPRDPPGAVRQQPRFSVTMSKGAAAETNETQNGGNHEMQENADAKVQIDETEPEQPEISEDAVVEEESTRDQELLDQTRELKNQAE